MKKMLLILLLVMFAGIASGDEARFYIIVNSSVHDNELKYADLVDIYTLTKQHWNDGKKIKVIDYKGENELKDQFYSLINISPDQIRKIWLKKQFTGKAMPPKTYRTEEEVIQAVKELPGAIGYVESAKLPEGVKILAKIK